MDGFYHKVNSETCTCRYKPFLMGKSTFHSDLKETLFLKDPPYFLELTSFFFAFLLISSLLLEEMFSASCGRYLDNSMLKIETVKTSQRISIW